MTRFMSSVRELMAVRQRTGTGRRLTGQNELEAVLGHVYGQGSDTRTPRLLHHSIQSL